MRKIVLTILFFSYITIAMGFTLYTGGNSWSLDQGTIDSSNYTFTSLPAKFNTYFYTSSCGEQFNMSILLDSSVNVNVKVTVGTTTRMVSIKGHRNFSPFKVGIFLTTQGYNKITTEITGASSGTGLVSSFDITGPLKDLAYVPNNDGNNFYWGRRGSSPNISPDLTGSNDISYFYSEIYVPVGYDPIGSYFMANGFGQGYFGIQVNSATERKVLFSVWSGFDTNDPSQIPADYTVTFSRSGPGVITGQFGDEGSGAQSYLIFNWLAGTRYKFLTKAKPLSNGATMYTAWFNDPKNSTNSGWRLIAQIVRPKIQTYLTGIYSFVECFDPDAGNQTRMAYYGNQWYYDSTNTWKESTSVTYDEDDAGRTGIRRDVEGGVYNRNMFFMRNGGFFNTTSAPGTKYTRVANKVPPNINFAKLP